MDVDEMGVPWWHECRVETQPWIAIAPRQVLCMADTLARASISPCFWPVVQPHLAGVRKLPSGKLWQNFCECLAHRRI